MGIGETKIHFAQWGSKPWP